MGKEVRDGQAKEMIWGMGSMLVGRSGGDCGAGQGGGGPTETAGRGCDTETGCAGGVGLWRGPIDVVAGARDGSLGMVKAVTWDGQGRDVVAGQRGASHMRKKFWGTEGYGARSRLCGAARGSVW